MVINPQLILIFLPLGALSKMPMLTLLFLKSFGDSALILNVLKRHWVPLRFCPLPKWTLCFAITAAASLKSLSCVSATCHTVFSGWALSRVWFVFRDSSGTSRFLPTKSGMSFCPLQHILFPLFPRLPLYFVINDLSLSLISTMNSLESKICLFIFTLAGHSIRVLN